MITKLDKIKQDLEKAYKKPDEWYLKVKELEKKYKETENTMIHDMVHAANITPEQLAKLIEKANKTVPHHITEGNTYDN